ncbi:DNA phosphorothioation-associated putative methyltransferase [Psychromonas sp. PT13]|uniref:DNA phosphorothioation-associated putative methyltransferase n=1 Tax=Psychromonas sp. PT13 TaxID=3439547 RepID=UPI003EC05550
MDAQLFAKLVKQITVGKKLPDAIYIHKDAFTAIPDTLKGFIPAVAKALKVEEETWHLVKLFKKEFRLSLLSYPDFYTDSYPALLKSINVDLTKLSHRITDYSNSENPPILHRKETMVLASNPHFEHFSQITAEGENAGLYENTRIIGFKQTWINLIHRHGYELVDGRLFRNSAIVPPSDENEIDRHRTAIVRHELSAPMKTLAKNGFLEGDYTIFDYGCGRGDDLRELEAHGLDVIGWDPNFQPDNDKVASDIVNIGFVLNVIEDQDERLEALIKAWELADKLLVVSVMLANESYINQFTPYKDGVITSRNTFQKYFAQSEIKAYIERHLDEITVTVAPGIFYIFKDKLAEQNYLQNKYKRHNNWQQLTSPEPIAQKDKAKLLITQHEALFNAFWQRCLALGRIPANNEFQQAEEIKSLTGSFKKTFTLLEELYNTSEFAQAQQKRKEDLLLYFAMSLFEKRKPYTQQPDNLKRDIKTHFGEYKTALNLATELLYAISDIDLIEEQCNKANASLPASITNKGHSLILHKNFIDQLPLLLRVYVDAALQMYGEIDEAIDLIKIHITSGKVTLTNYDDFENKAVPFLVERIKIKMADQDIDFFDYINESRRPPLLNKGALIDETFVNYKKQISFDKRLAKLLNTNLNEDVLLSRGEFDSKLNSENKKVVGFTIKSSIKN